jgi:hypothetical protein
MRVADAAAWFDDYLSAFAAFGRGELDDPRVLLDYYAGRVAAHVGSA